MTYTNYTQQMKELKKTFQMQGLKFWEEDNTLYQVEPCEIPVFIRQKLSVLSVSQGLTDAFVLYDVEFEMLVVSSTFIPHSCGKFSRFGHTQTLGQIDQFGNHLKHGFASVRRKKRNQEKKLKEHIY